MDNIHGHKAAVYVKLSAHRKKALEFFFAIKGPECTLRWIEDKYGFHLLAKFHDDAFVQVAFKFIALLVADVLIHIAQSHDKSLQSVFFIAVGKETHLVISFHSIDQAPKGHCIR